MVVPLIASALLLDFLGCMMPLALVEDTKAFKVGVFLISSLGRRWWRIPS